MLRSLRIFVLILVGIALPVEYVTLFDMGNVTITPTKLVGILLLAVGALHLLSGRRPPRAGLHGWVIAYNLAIGAATVVSVASGLPFVSIVPSLVTVFSIFLFYLVVSMLIGSVQDLEALALGIVAGGVFVGATALLGVGFVTSSATETRVGGLGGNPNEMAFNLCVALAAAMGLFIRARGMGGKVFAAGSAAIIVASILASLSRSAYVAVGVMWLFLIISLRRLDLLKYAVPAAFAAGLVVLLLSPEAKERISTLRGGARSDGSVMARVITNRHAVDAFLSNPVVGVGYRYFTFWVQKGARGVDTGNVVHGSYLAVASEEGLVGLVPFLAIHVLAWQYLTRARRLVERSPHRSDRDLGRIRFHAIVLQVALLGAIMGGLFHPSREYKALWLLFGAAPAVFAVGRARIRALESSSHVADRSAAFATDALGWQLDVPQSVQPRSS